MPSHHGGDGGSASQPPPLQWVAVSEVAAPPPPVRTRTRTSRTLVRDILEVLALALALYIVIAFALQTVRVDGTSMVPTLDNNDLLFANKLSYHFHAPERGDIVVLRPPDDPSRDFIKRVIGVPGDTLQIDGKWVDPGKPGSAPQTAILIKPDGRGPWQHLSEPYLPDPWVTNTFCCDSTGHTTSSPSPLTLPKDQFFVLGDNRNESRDSRFIGLIPRANIIGKAWVRIWPLGRLGFFGSGPSLAPVAAMMLPLPLVRRGRRRQLARAA